MASYQSSTSTPTGLPSGISEPYAAINASDWSGLIAILTAFSLGLVLTAIAIRIYARHNFTTYRVDDYTFFAASIFSITQSALVFYQIGHGLGKLEELPDPENVNKVQKAGYASDLFYIFTIFLSKCSAGFLFLYLTPGRAHMRVIWATIAASVVWVVSGIVLEAIRCNPQHPWTDDTSTCTNSFARWAFIASFDVLIEVALIATSIYIVWSLQMELKSKAIVVGAFCARIPNIATSVIRLVYLHKVLLVSNAHVWNSRVVSMTQLAIGYSVAASIVPYLKPFMMAYERPETSRDYSYPLSGSNKSYQLSALQSKNSKSGTASVTDALEDDGELREGKRRSGGYLRAGLGKLRPDQTNYQAKATHDGIQQERTSDDRSDDSQIMIIKKGVEWSVQYEHEHEAKHESTALSAGSAGRDHDEIRGHV